MFDKLRHLYMIIWWSMNFTMKLKEKIKKTCRVRNLIRFCLISLFLWWGTNAVVKYWNQPLSTDIRYRQEEAKPGNQFPLITLCNSRDFFGNPIIKDCVDGLSWNFIGTGKSLSEALLFAKHGENMLCTKIVLNVRNNFCTQHILPRFELGIFMY